MKREMRSVRFLFSITCLAIVQLVMSPASAQQISSRTRVPVLQKVTYDGQVSEEKIVAPVSPAYMEPGMFYIMSPIEEQADSTVEEPALSPRPLIAHVPLTTAFGVDVNKGSYRYGYAYSNYNTAWSGFAPGNSSASGGTNLFGWFNYPFSSSNLLTWTGNTLDSGYALFNKNILAPWFNSQLSDKHNAVPPVDGGKPGDPIGQPNPAAVYCAENGGDYQITTSADGSQDGVCVFSDGSQCDGWAYYRGECQPAGGHNTMPPLDGGKPGDPIGQPDPAAVFCTETGGTYETRTDKDGGQYGVCVFDDGSECDAWVYFLGECRPSGESVPQIMPPLDGGKPEAPIGMANPASVYCTENGGYSKIRTSEDGSQYGVCVFKDGTECDEWAFFRGECQPSDATSMVPPLYDGNLMIKPSVLPVDDTPALGMANPAAVYYED